MEIFFVCGSVCVCVVLGRFDGVNYVVFESVSKIDYSLYSKQD